MRTLILVLLFFALQARASDPSSVAERAPSGRSGYAERWRVRADFDGDGHEDMLLSSAIPKFGKMGGSWSVYIWREGDYYRVGELFAHPRAIAIERDRDRMQRAENQRFYVRIWTYLRDSGSSGGLGYYRIGPREVIPVKGLQIYPGDGGTDMGRATYEAVFKHSQIAFTLERSQTSAEGNVTWRADGP